MGKIPEDLEQPTASAELVAVLLTTQMMAPEILLRPKSSCDVVLKAMTKDPKTNEDRGWIGVKNRKTMKALAATLRAWKAKTVIAVVNRNKRGCAEALELA